MGYKLALAAVTGLMLWRGTAKAAPLPKVPTGYAARSTWRFGLPGS